MYALVNRAILDMLQSPVLAPGVPKVQPTHATARQPRKWQDRSKYMPREEEVGS